MSGLEYLLRTKKYDHALLIVKTKKTNHKSPENEKLCRRRLVEERLGVV